MNDNLIKGDPKRQIAKTLYYYHKQSMKQLLQLGEFRFGGRDAGQYKHFKKQVMNTFYKQLNKIFEVFVEDGVLEVCGCGASIDQRRGYTPCQSCSGCGYKNSDFLNDAMAFSKGWTSDHKECLRRSLLQEKQ